MSELLSDEDPEPLSGLEHGYHYYDIHTFLRELGPDMRAARMEDEWREPTPYYREAPVEGSLPEVQKTRRRRSVAKMGFAVQLAMRSL